MLEPRHTHLVIASRQWWLCRPEGVQSGAFERFEQLPAGLAAALGSLPLFTRVHAWLGVRWCPLVAHATPALRELSEGARQAALAAMARQQCALELAPESLLLQHTHEHALSPERSASVLLPLATLNALKRAVGWRRLVRVSPLWAAAANCDGCAPGTAVLLEEPDALSEVLVSGKGALAPVFGRCYEDAELLAAAREQRAMSREAAPRYVRLVPRALSTQELLAAAPSDFESQDAPPRETGT